MTFVSNYHVKIIRAKPIQPSNQTLHTGDDHFFSVAGLLRHLKSYRAIVILGWLSDQFFPVRQNQYPPVPWDACEYYCLA
jgi:hypothetical protein